MSLQVYVFGPGVGESIVLRFPGDGGEDCWGVIDCHSRRLVQFLNDEHNVKQLEFVCWTHPHSDHHDGMPELLKTYEKRINRFWRFGGHCANTLLAFPKCWSKEIKRIEETEFGPIEKIFEFALKQKKFNPPNSYKILTDIQQGLLEVKYGDGSSFKITSLGPSSSLAEEYTSHIKKCLEDPDAPDWEAFNGAHNDISVVLLAEFGETQILFGADAEKKAWKDIYNSEQRRNLKVGLSSHFVKISHHGSEGAYHEDSWIEISQDFKPNAVMTPFNKCHLPNSTAINLLKYHCNEIYQTATRKNYRNYKTESGNTRRKYKWKTYEPDIDYCVFEFDQQGNLTVTLADSSVTH